MEIKVPDLGVDSAEVSEIMVNVGDVINVDDNIVLLESDKASVEVPATAAGTITAINVNLGDKVKEGDSLLTVETQDSSDTPADTAPKASAQTAPTSNPVPTSEAAAATPASSTAPAQATNTNAVANTASSEASHALPDLGVDEAQVSEWLVNVGDTVEKDQPLVLVESDKASVEVPAPVAGTLVRQLVNAGDTVKNGQDFVVIASADNGQSAEPTPATSPAQTSAPVTQVSATQTTASTVANSAPTEQTYALPDLGVESAQVSEWMVQEGDTIDAEQPIVLVESDKASVEVPAPASGKVVKLLVKAGDKVSNGQDFIVIASRTAAPANSAPTTSATAAPAAMPTAAPSAPTAAASQPAMTPSQSVVSKAATTQLTESQINAKHADVYAGPAVRKLTRQLGVDISEVKGSGAHGRIVKEDIFAYVKNRMQTLTTAPSASSTAAAPVRSGLPNLPDMSKTEIWGDIETQELSRLQKVSIPQLNYNTYLPQVTQFDLSDITDTEAMRGELKDEMKKQGVSLTILAFIMKATAYALMQHPKFNSHLSDDNTHIIVRKTVHMGFAVATPTGLTVPVIKDVQNKGIKQIAIEIGEMAAKARDNKLTPKDLTGASFTISSQGNLGGTYFTPLVTWPQVAILGVSEASMQPRWNETTKTFEPRLMLPLSLSYDHRVINGADAAVFTRYIAKLLADPRRILL